MPEDSNVPTSEASEMGRPAEETSLPAEQPREETGGEGQSEMAARSPATLEETLAEFNLSLFPEQIQALDRYFRLRNEWNQQMNLTRHTDYRKFVGRDIIDTLSFARVLGPDEVVLDVGTGSGVPGIVLAILRPDLQIALCESVSKRARAVADMCEKLGLPLPVLVGKAENFLAAGGWEFHSLLVRAVATLLELMRWFKPYWAFFDRMLLLKGPTWVEERGQARHYGVMHGYALRVVDRYTIPGTEAESVLLQVCPEDRLVPPRGCQLRKLRYEIFPKGLITPDRPGPLARLKKQPTQVARKDDSSKSSQSAKSKKASKQEKKFAQSPRSAKGAKKPSSQNRQLPEVDPRRVAKMKPGKRKGDQTEKGGEKNP